MTTRRRVVLIGLIALCAAGVFVRAGSGLDLYQNTYVVVGFTVAAVVLVIAEYRARPK